MSIRFVIDSASDVLPSECEKMGVYHVPLTVSFEEEEFRDAVDLTHKEFYEKLIESDVLPVTSQASPLSFAEIFKKITEAGDTAVVITLSSDLSGTYQSACIAAKDYPGKVFVIDSKTVTVGERILLERGMELAESGMPIEELVSKLEEEKLDIRLLAVLDTLEYLKKGGRISSAVAFAGGLLSIKPVISITDGKVALLGKARGSKNSNNLLRKLITESRGIDFSRPLCLAYSGLTDILVKKYIEDSAELWQSETNSLPIATVGTVIGTHVGPGAVAVCFYEKH